MAFDIAGARKEGYSDKEIADFLATQHKFNVDGARTEGYSDTEIADYLSAYQPPQTNTSFKPLDDSHKTGRADLSKPTAEEIASASSFATPKPATQQPSPEQGFTQVATQQPARPSGPRASDVVQGLEAPAEPQDIGVPQDMRAAAKGVQINSDESGAPILGQDLTPEATQAGLAEARKHVPVTVRPGMEKAWLKQNNPGALAKVYAVEKAAMQEDIAAGSAAVREQIAKQEAGENVARDAYGKPIDDRGFTQKYGADAAKGILEGGAQLVKTGGDIYGLVFGDMDNWASNLGDAAVKSWRASQSDYQRARDQYTQDQVEKAEETGGQFSAFVEGAKQAIDDPLMLASRQLYNLATTGAGAAASKLAAKKFLKQASEKTLIEIGVAGGIATGAAMQGADVGADAYDEVKARLLKSGVPPEEAETQALALGRLAAAKAATISIITNKVPWGDSLERAFAGGLKSGGIKAGIVNTAKALTGEALQEGSEEGFGKRAQNESVRIVDPSVSEWRGVGSATGQGAAAGLVMGGGAGTISAAQGGDKAEAPGTQEQAPSDMTAAVDRQPETRVQAIKREIEARKAALRQGMGLPAGEVNQDELLAQLQGDAANGATGSGTAEVAETGGQGWGNLGAESVPTAVAPAAGAGLDTDSGEPVAGGKGNLPAGNAGGEDAVDAAELLNDGEQSPIDEAAHEAATSPQNDLPEPTDAQKEAGNYRKGHITLHGLDISIENPRGSTRSGVDQDGKAWETTLAHHYGYVKRTEGADGDQVDVFIGDKPESDKVFVVDQIDPKTGKFDEHKALLGFDSQEEALAAYHANYQKGWKGANAVHAMTADQFKGWLENGDTKRPIGQDGINPDMDEDAPTWAGRYDVIEKGGAPKGYRLLGKNADGNEVYEAGTSRAVVSGDYVVRELAHKPSGERVAEFRTAAELGQKPSRVQQIKAEVTAKKGLSIGTTPNNAEPITVKNGVVHIGKYPAAHFETGEDITVPDGADNAAIAQALRDAGAVGNRHKIFGVEQSRDQVGTKRPKKSAFATTDTHEYSEASRKMFLAVIRAAGGIKATEASDITGEPVHIANRQSPGLFKKDGTNLDLIAGRLHELGYLSDEDYNDVDGGVQAVRDLVRQALNREFVGTAEQAERLAELEAQAATDNAQLQEEESQALADNLSEELSSDDIDLPDLDAPGNMSEAEAMRALGFTEQEIEEATNGQGNQDAQAGTGAPADGPAGAGAQAGTQGGDEQAPSQAVQGQDQGFELARQTEAELGAKDAEAKKTAEAEAKAEAAAEAKAKADRERDNFTLTGSDRAADANPNQGDIFSQPAEKPEVSSNTVFTEDAAAAARALLKKKLGGQLNSGLDPEVMQAGITLAGYHIEKGARSFTAYAKAMIEDLGEAVKPYLKSWYVAIKLDPRAAGFAGDMDGMAEVEAADVESVSKQAQSADSIPTTEPEAAQDKESGGDNKLIALGFKHLPKDYTYSMTVQSGNNREYLFNVREFGTPRQYRVTMTVRDTTGQVTAAPSRELLAAGGIDEAAQAVQKRLDEINGEQDKPGEFKNGDRVQITASHYNKDIAGRHGEVADVRKVTWTSSVIDLTSRGLGVTKQSEETHVYYDIKTDGGFIAEGVQPEQIEAETGRVASVPDPVVDGKAMTPEALQRSIKSSRDASRNYLNKADAARKADKKAEWRRMALAEDAKTAKLMQAWAAWAKEHGNAAEAVGTEIKPATQPAATDTAGILKAAGLVVKASQTKHGTPTWEVSGNTREHSETIKRLGGRWYGPKKVWSFYKGDPSEQLAQALGVKVESSRVSAIVGEVKTATGNGATLNAGVNDDAEQPRIPEQARPQAGDGQADRGDGRDSEPSGRPLGGGMAEADARPGETGNADAGSEGPGRTGSAGSGVRESASVGGRDREPTTLRDRPERAAADGLTQTPSSEGVSLSGEPRADFTIGDDTQEAIEEGGQKTKARNNIAAIRMVKKLAAEDRRATMDEQKAIAKYVGWGGIKQIFDEGKADWSALRDELKNLLTAEEYAAANRSILDAHFTSMDVVSGMWGAAKHLGFHGGRVLEPSVGVGNFFGAMPSDMRANSAMFGVELDNITGQIAKYLYPNATIATPVGFQDIEFPSGSFDFATGNPPFGEQSLYDRAHPEFRNFSIHQFFFAKALDKVRPGGILQMVVSRYLMDARDGAGMTARAHLAQHARLLGAIRLPYNAFLSNANTEVVTDIVFLQKLEDGEDGNAADWTGVADIETVHPKTGERFTFSVNRYFVDHPEMVVGTHAPTGKMRQANQYNVEPPSEPLALAIGKAVANLPRDVYRDAGKPLAELASADAVVPEGTKVFGYYLDGETIMQRLPDSVGMRQARSVEFKNGMAPKRAARMIRIRDALRSLMRAELSEDASDSQIAALRAELNREYDGFRKTFGYINQPANRRAFADDPDLPLLESLEPKFDPGLGTEAAKKRGEPARKPSAEKADIFAKRVLQPLREVRSVETAKDALVVSLNERGRIDPEHMAEIYGKPWEDIRSELGDLIYLDPNGSWETADAYLSGNVKAKLKHARAAAEKDPAFSPNVAALEAVQPADMPALKISVRLGSPWIPNTDMDRFVTELFGAKQPRVRFVPQVAKWSVQIAGGDETARYATWGTRRVPAEDVLEHVLNNKPIVVKDNHGDSKNPNWVTNEPETEAARAKAQEMAAKFREWIWQDQERRNRLERIYNDNYNTDVRRKYDGAHLTLPGSNPAIQLRPHQKAAIWRAIQDRSILLDHVVGAGKTFEMAAIAMELRRLGVSRKPMFMVPNSLVRQWRDEFYKLYPNANVLAATEADFAKANRRRFMAKIATGDWDAVVVAHSSFKKIGMPADTEKAILNEQLKEIADAIEEMKRERGDRNIMRDMERMKEKIAERLKALSDKGGKKDDVVTFDELGTDALMLDEAHLFKNLFYMSSMRNVAGLGNPTGSGRAFDLFVKLRYLDQRYSGKAPVVFATGTPVSNSLVEMFTMQRYMAWNTLKDRGLHLLDAWAGVYGDVQNVYEVHPSGTGYRLSTRFAKFVNLPSLMDLYRSFADVVTMDDLKDQAKAAGTVFPVPKIKGGRPQNVVADRSEEQTKFFGVPEFVRDPNGAIVLEYNAPMSDYGVAESEDEPGKWVITQNGKPLNKNDVYDDQKDAKDSLLAKLKTPKLQWNEGSILWKFENLRELNKESNGKINALSITNEARKAGLDFRLINPAAPDFADSKINKAVENVLRIHKAWAADRGTQLIFCDLSVPQSAKAAAAVKEREAFVRREDGTLEKVKATVATVEGVERAFLVVKRGSGEAARFMVYDGATGASLEIETASRADAGKALAKAFESDLGMADRLEQFSPIDDAEIADWEDANEKESAEEDGDSDGAITVGELMGLAGGAKFSVYDDIKAKLIASGIPEKEVAFIHDYDTAAKKNDLFKRVNAGEIRVLLGSTEKMGAGMNVQKRLVALHHLDAPWRPSDLEQREGRIVRQGNDLYARDPDGFEVEILRYGTRQTYDTRMWQIIEHKAAGVEQLRKAGDDMLEIDDVGGEAANAADMKAAASGNPLILEEIKLRNEVKSLEAQQFGHIQARAQMQDRISFYRRAPERMREDLDGILPFKEAAESNPAKPFRYKSPAGKVFDDIKNVTTPITEAFVLAAKGRSGDVVKAGEYRGMNIEFYRVHSEVAANVEKGGKTLWVAGYSMDDKFSPAGLFTRIDNAVAKLAEREQDIRENAERKLAEIPKLEAEVDKPFAKEDELRSTRQKHREIVSKLAKSGGGIEMSAKMKSELQLELVKRQLILSSNGMVETPAAGYVAQPGGKGYIDPYESLETRANTTERQREAGRAALADAERRIFGRRSGVLASASLLGSRISQGFRGPGGVSLVGQTARTAEELATVAQVLRDPRFETFRVFYTDKAGKVIGERAYSSRLPGAVYYPDDFHDNIAEDKARLNASGYWVLHNHPSGVANASVSDKNETEKIAFLTPGFLGHVIIDHNEFGHISINEAGKASAQVIKAPQFDAIDLYATPEVPHPLLGELIHSSDVLAGIAKRLQQKDGYAVLIGTDAQGGINMLTEVPVNLLRDAKSSRVGGLRIVASVKRATRETGSYRLFAIVPGSLSDYVQAVQSGLFFDVYDQDGVSARRIGVVGDKMHVSNTERRGGKSFAKTPDTPYNAGPPGKPPSEQRPPKGGLSASGVPEETRARRAQRIVQDQFNRFTVIQDWLRDNGVNIDTKKDVYRAEERMHGKIAAQIEDFRAKRLQPLIVRIHKAGFNMQQVGEYLVANHAQERNAQIAKINPKAVNENGEPNGSGMTDAEAAAVLAKYQDAGFKALAEEFRSITEDTKRTLLDSGIIGKDMADAWEAAYRHYVPLRGGPDGIGQGDATGKGVSVNARSERRRAMGHKARDEWVVENIIHAHERAIYLAEKNRVGQHLAALVASVPDSRLWTIDKPVKRQVLRPGQPVYAVSHKGIVVGSFDTRKEADLFITAMVTSANKNPGDFAVEKTMGDPQVAYMASGSLADNEVQIYVKGNTVRIQLNDPLLARAYKKMGQTNLVGILELGRQINAFLSKAYTGLNPEFIVSNMQRDLISGVVNITGEEGIGMAGKVFKNWLPSFRDMLRYSMGGEPSMWVQMYREDGGNTGAAYLGDLERIAKDVNTAFDEAVGVRQLFKESKPGKAASVALKKSVRLVTAWIEHMNAAAENGMRVALYRSMIEAGRSRAQASSAAKNSTVNFNRKGEIGAQMSALYLFANPSVQGTASMGHALFKGKHKGQAWALMGALAAMAYLAALGYGDDDDWDEVPQYEKDRNLLIRVGDKVVKVAVPYGHGIAFALGNAIYDLQRGKDVSAESYHMASSILENMAPVNPLGDKQDLQYAVTELMPFEPARIFARVANNTTGFQRQIRPESKFDESQPDFLKAYRNTHGSVYDQLTRGMSKATGGTATQAGAVDVSPETLRFLFESATGGTGRFFMDTVHVARLATEGALPEIQETPMLRKFVRDANRVSDARGRFWATVDEAETVLENFRRAKNGIDVDAADKFKGMNLAGLSGVVERYKDVSRQARDAVSAIKAMDNKTEKEKRLMIFEVERVERDLYRRMVDDINGRINPAKP